MKIVIKAFGIAREIAGKQQWEVIVDDHFTIDELRALLIEELPKLKTIIQFSLAKNQVYVVTNEQLSEGDEIAIIPPVSGG
ncbi:MAG: MoaD/ThiS family protein [Flavobacteriales bacterium]